MTESTLSSGSVVHALRELIDQRKSGVLAVRRGTPAIHICLQDGRVVYATSNLKRFQNKHWLIAAELVSSEAVSAVGATSGTKELVDILVGKGDSERLDLVTSLRNLLREMALEAMTWDGADLRFSPGVPVLRQQILMDGSTETLLEEAARRRGDVPTQAVQPSGTSVAPDNQESISEEPSGQEKDPYAEHPEVVAFREKVRFSRQQNYYELLDLDIKSEVKDVRKRYYQMARSFHPDALSGILAEACRSEAEEFFATVTDAYNGLTRPEQRKEYDQQLRSKTGGHRENTDQNPAELAKHNFDSGRKAVAAGELHDATQFFRNAVQLDPDQGEYHRELGIVEMRNPRWQKSAEESLRRAIQLEQTDTRALSHLGQIYQKNGLNRRAMETYQLALDWDPDNEMALGGLAQLKEATGSSRKSLFRRN